MLFNSYQFLLFLPLVLLIYFVIPGKLRTGWLLLMSYVFYFSFRPKYIVVLLFVTVVSYFAGLLLEEDGNKKKFPYYAGIIVSVMILVFFKYTEFLLDNINVVLEKAVGRGQMLSLPFSLVLPVGVSYFTFQMISYLTDVYKGRVKAERNPIAFALFVAFFPKIISGPIERAGDFLVQIHDCHTWKLWKWERVRSGLILLLWGYFQKMVIADRLAILTDTVFGNYRCFGTIELAVAAMAFYIQLYTDFAGCIDMARGMAEIMGFTLAENFKAPFFAKSIREYWARWHISLSMWLRDYIYIPLGGNRKGKVRKYVNLMLTFFVSGFWHGAAWNFVFWGVLHGCYQVIGQLFSPIMEEFNKKIKTRTESFSYQLLQTVKCWLLVCAAYIFFKVPTLKDGINYIQRMLTKWNPWALFDGSLYELGLSQKYCSFMLAAILVLLCVDYLKYKRCKSLPDWLCEQCIWFRSAVMLLVLMCIIVFGAYGPAYHAENFIYFKF